MREPSLEHRHQREGQELFAQFIAEEEAVFDAANPEQEGITMYRLMTRLAERIASEKRE